MCHLSVLGTRHSSLTGSVQPGLSTQAQVDRLLASPAVNCLSQTQVKCPLSSLGTHNAKTPLREGSELLRSFRFLSKVHILKAKYAGFKRNIMNFFHDKKLSQAAIPLAFFLPVYLPTLSTSSTISQFSCFVLCVQGRVRH